MASRIVALIGTGKGPRVCVGGIEKPQLRLSREVAEEIIVDYGTSKETLQGAKKFPLQETEFISLEYLGSDTRLICSIVSGV